MSVKNATVDHPFYRFAVYLFDPDTEGCLDPSDPLLFHTLSEEELRDVENAIKARLTKRAEKEEWDEWKKWHFLVELFKVCSSYDLRTDTVYRCAEAFPDELICRYILHHSGGELVITIMPFDDKIHKD